jgi:pyruvate dehydrogenase E2 component (dihydrolipoamide acetyltransferase)
VPELLRMPEVAAGATHAVLSTWSTPEGQAFEAGGVIAIIETDKAIVDFEAEADGVILRRLAAEGEEVAIGDPIALIAAPGESVPDVDAAVLALAGDVAASPSAPAAATPEAAPEGAPLAAPAPAPPVGTSTAEAIESGERIFASPLARRLAKERGIDLATVRGTGPNGRIRRRDIEAAQLQPAAPAAAPAAPVAAAGAGYVDVPHTRLRRAIAARLTQSVTTAPHFYLRGTARVDALMALRAQLNAGEDLRVSVNDLVIKAVAGAHVRVPAANAIWTDDAIRMFDTVDIAVAVATDNGLVTPVLRGVESLSITQVARATKDFAVRARAGELRQSELEGGSTSVSNLGMYGTDEFAAIINPPHSSILAVGAATEEPVVDDGVLAIGTVMRVTLSVDHRPIDGAVAAQWMREFIGLLEQPAKILA